MTNINNINNEKEKTTGIKGINNEKKKNFFKEIEEIEEIDTDNNIDENNKKDLFDDNKDLFDEDDDDDDDDDDIDINDNDNEIMHKNINEATTIIVNKENKENNNKENKEDENNNNDENNESENKKENNNNGNNKNNNEWEENDNEEGGEEEKDNNINNDKKDKEKDKENENNYNDDKEKIEESIEKITNNPSYKTIYSSNKLSNIDKENENEKNDQNKDEIRNQNYLNFNNTNNQYYLDKLSQDKNINNKNNFSINKNEIIIDLLMDRLIISWNRNIFTMSTDIYLSNNSYCDNILPVEILPKEYSLNTDEDTLKYYVSTNVNDCIMCFENLYKNKKINSFLYNKIRNDNYKHIYNLFNWKILFDNDYNEIINYYPLFIERIFDYINENYISDNNNQIKTENTELYLLVYPLVNNIKTDEIAESIQKKYKNIKKDDNLFFIFKGVLNIENLIKNSFISDVLSDIKTSENEINNLVNSSSFTDSIFNIANHSIIVNIENSIINISNIENISNYNFDNSNNEIAENNLQQQYDYKIKYSINLFDIVPNNIIHNNMKTIKNKHINIKNDNLNKYYYNDLIHRFNYILSNRIKNIFASNFDKEKITNIIITGNANKYYINKDILSKYLNINKDQIYIVKNYSLIKEVI